jgi:hypothetical protein
VTSRKLWLAIALPIVVALALLIWFYPTNSDFSAENPLWNGTEEFATEFKALPLSSLDSLPSVTQGTTLMLIPYLELSDADLGKLERYLSVGGRLLLLDDYGFGNEVLERLGLGARFTGTQLLDPLFNYKNKDFPKIIDFAPDSITNGVTSIVFNHATSLKSIPSGQVIAQSSHFSFLDENQNGRWDEEEPKGHLPVVAKFLVGRGELILVADPSILISSMVNMDDNHQFLENIVQGQFFIDQSHLPQVALDEAKGMLKVTRNALATIGGTLGLLVLILAWALRPIWHKPTIKQEQRLPR